MKIKRLVVQNFKSYKDTIVDRLSPKANIIIGQNGHGKSNVHIALLFLFSDLYSTETPQTKREALYEGLPPDSEVYVEALIDNEGGLIQGEEKEVLLRKTIAADGKLLWRINQRQVSGAEYDTMLELAGIRKTNPANFILQGKIKRISQTDEVGLYSLLEETVGTRAYEERKLESKELLHSVVLDEKKAHELLDDFQTKLHEIQVEKEDYKRYEEDVEAGNLIYFTLYSRKITHKSQKRLEVDKIIDTRRAVIMQLRQEQFSMTSQINQLEQKIAEHQLELENSDAAVTELSGEIQKYERQLGVLKTQSEQDATHEQSLSLKELTKKKAEVEKLREASYKHLIGLQQELKAVQGQFELCKIKREQLLHLRGGGSGLKDILKKKLEQLTAGIQSRKADAKAEDAETNQLNAQLDKLTKDLHKFEKEQQTFSKEEAQILEAIRDQEKEKSAAVSAAVNTKYSLATAKDKLLELQSQTEEARKKVEVSGDFNLSGLLRLLDELRNGAVEGVHGLLIDLVDISSKILSSVDLLIPSANLFAVVVRDEEVARQVDRINKALKGPRIRIYPLTWLQQEEGQEERTYPDKREKAIIIEKFVQTKQGYSDIGLQPLISDVFGGNLMVEKLQDAHTLAAKYGCNCVTFDSEIVYANNFMTQLGYRDQKESHLKKYLAFRTKHAELSKLKASVEGEEKIAEEARERELTAQQTISELKLKREKLRLAETQREGETVTLRKAVLQLRKLVQESELRSLDLRGEIQALEAELHELQSTKSSFRVEKYDEKVFKETDTKFDQLSTQVKKLLENIDRETRSFEEHDHQLEKHSELLRGFEKGQLSLENDKREKTMIQDEIKKTKELVANLKTHLEERKGTRRKIKEGLEAATSELSKLDVELRAKKSDVERAQQDLQGYTQSKFDLTLNIDTFSSKLEQLGVVPHEHKDALKKLENKPDKDLVGLLKNILMSRMKYTDKDKVNFEKLEEYFENHHEYEDELKNLKAGKRIFFQVVDKVDQRVEEINRNSFQTFRNHFRSLFEQIVPKGFADLELVEMKAPLQTQMSDRQVVASPDGPRKGIRIVSNFESDVRPPTTTQGGTSSLASLSPGQKTVLSVCIVMALQKCCPSPFYCFDEIDADLDQAYVRAITRVMEEVARTSQIFVTTFRPEALQLKDAAIYKVEMIGSKSDVSKCTIDHAREFLQR